MTPRSIAIVGGGVAGFTTAQELRRAGYDGRLTIVEPQGLPYDRPPLSKEYLAGQLDAERLPFEPPDWYAEQAVELLRETVTALDLDAPSLTLASGQRLDADAIVLATGGRPRSLPVTGGDDDGLLYLRVKPDADRLREVLDRCRRLAIVGAGLIGAEVASTAAARGLEVTLIDPFEVPGVAAFGPEIAAELHAMHAAHGVRTIVGGVDRIERTASGWNVTVGGDDISADAVLVSVGIAPETGLAEAAGLEVDGGVIVDEGQRTSHPRVWAVGDIARRRRPDGTLRRRHEHWESAMHSGVRAAASLLGAPPPAESAPWFWSDRYGVHVEAVGTMAGGRTVLRERAGRPWIAFQVDANRLLGAVAIDGGTAVRAARRMIDRHIAVDPAALADPGVDLRKLAR